MPDSEGVAEIAGARLEYSWHRPSPGAAPARPTLVFLHEGLGCVAMWRDFPEQLAVATGLGALVYSRRGYGGSYPVYVPRPLSYMHDEAFETLGPLLDHFAISSAVLVGHSDGASIAAIYAGGVRDPRVRGLVLMAPHFIVEDISVSSIAAAKTAFETTGLRDKLARYHGANTDCAFWGWNGAWLDPEFRKWDIGEYLPGISVPTLIIQGENDEYGTVRQVEVAQEKCSCPLQVALLADCGHTPFRDQPEAVLDTAGRFIGALPGVKERQAGYLA